jgi:Cof subfamily protein (haloacid dehalogenase superfamily)
VAILSDYAGILFDVDMTLTNSAREVTLELADTLKKLTEAGYTLGTCTGRAYIALKQPILPLFAPNAAHITAGGSQVITTDGQVIWQTLLPEQTCFKLHQLGQQYNQMYYLPTLEHAYASKSFIERYQGLHSLIPPLRPIEELGTWQASYMVFVNISPEFQSILEQLDDVTYKTSISTQRYVSVDVTPKGVNKATGVLEWCKYHGVTPEQVIGIGDSDNDLEFLNCVGFSVAMGNSTSAILKRAKRVIDHTDQNGLAVYLQQLLKGSSL